MREIKFRAWDLERKKMIHFAEKGICSEYNQLTFEVQEEEEKEYFGCLPDNDNILMQYTGLKDKNGVEIYEGDIMKRKNGELYSVQWTTDGCECIANDITGLSVNHWDEVIGNIYQNPELLDNKE
jgi:uncharacterized phage protein (TIGR01671 family)